MVRQNIKRKRQRLALFAEARGYEGRVAASSRTGLLKRRIVNDAAAAER